MCGRSRARAGSPRTPGPTFSANMRTKAYRFVARGFWRVQHRCMDLEPLLLNAVRLLTFSGATPLTAGSGFWFRREGRLFLVTSRHVFFDAASGHQPDRIEFDLHLDGRDLTRRATVALPLYVDGHAGWVQGQDSGGDVDVAVLEVAAGLLPAGAVLSAFAPTQLVNGFEGVHAAAALAIVGFPLGFYDTMHGLPVVRQATVASAFGVRFQGRGFFLTDARLHRGASGAPVVMRRDADASELPWLLLGIHSSQFDMGTRDRQQDDSLGLNCAWYADILLTLTACEPQARGSLSSGGKERSAEPEERITHSFTGVLMGNDELRTLQDRVARDEAASRAAQQVSAGQDHSPVEVYPAHGSPSRIPRSVQASDRLAQAYTCALEVERRAWELLPAFPGDPAFVEAPWNAWRSAVEERDEATRLLINYALTQT